MPSVFNLNTLIGTSVAGFQFSFLQMLAYMVKAKGTTLVSGSPYSLAHEVAVLMSVWVGSENTSMS